MTREAGKEETYTQQDHQVAYVFDPEGDGDGTRQKPAKRRRVSKQAQEASEAVENSSPFVPLLNGAEKPELVQLRETLFQESWAKIGDRIEGILQTSNSETLDQVKAFVEDAKTDCGDRIPSAFIITGPNIASQDLLFQQLSDALQQATPSKFVRLRSSEASTLKATLKKIIRDVTAKVSDEEDDDLHVGDGGNGRRYLDYDLEALHAFVNPQGCEHVFVAFQDSEGFDSSLLSDLIILFNSWRPRIPFTLLFGIATSVELLQARLLKSACQLIYGAQFDVIQTSAILETVFKAAVAAADAPILLGTSLLRSMLDRQHDQVSGIQTFTMSLKYAYMCHFYANPLSVLGHTSTLQAEHTEASRHVSSFREHVEQAVESGNLEHIQYAKDLLERDDFLTAQVEESLVNREESIKDFLRALLIIQETDTQDGEFSRAYVAAMEDGISISEESRAIESVRRMEINELMAMARKVIAILRDGDNDLFLGPATKPAHIELQDALTRYLVELEELHSRAEEQGITLRSKYSGQSKVMRTTVIAQRVQLSRDSAALTEEGKQLTRIVDDMTALLTTHVHAPKPSSLLLSESWLYDSRAPSRDVFVPRPRVVLERSLTRPHDYLSCSCCKPGEQDTAAMLPATALLYRLYLETGSLINVADLWAAFAALVGDDEADERKTLVKFYRGLAELRALGFVKASKKKADHIAKLKWL
ncbi:Origin recognition complex subunit 3 [Fusarium piperis]|uniref:Origin recognition complex subunit 3 n=1 Tax=Fusarium piperis TaxID=1435070 RepID=A0A9W8WDD3_9HYPO|nr:Origin recognition complex subunit 3 [Fusarium piperis]